MNYYTYCKKFGFVAHPTLQKMRCYLLRNAKARRASKREALVSKCGGLNVFFSSKSSKAGWYNKRLYRQCQRKINQALLAHPWMKGMICQKPIDLYGRYDE